MTAPTLSIPSGSLAAAVQQARARISPGVAVGVAVGVAGALAARLLAGTIEPAVVGLLAVVIAAWLAGTRGAAAAALLALVAVLVSPTPSPQAGGGLRIMLTALGLGAAAYLAGSQRDQLRRFAGASARDSVAARLDAFGQGLGEARPERLPEAVLERVSTLVGAPMAALTVLDPRTGRHHVRAVRGTTRAAVGVEVLPGVGLAGEALRDRRVVLSGRQPTGVPLVGGAVASLQRLVGERFRIDRRVVGRAALSAGAAGDGGRSRGAPAIALPAIHGGEVVATVIVGRARDGQPFNNEARVLLEMIGPQVGLAIANGLLRGQLSESSLVDPVTGLYNRAYLDAALSQLLALRRRTPEAERRPLSLVLFDLDGFTQLNERHGERSGDEVLRAVAALLKRRFRESDTIARVGGDGFFVVLDGADTTNASAAAAHIRAQVRAMALTDEHGVPLPVSISAGVTMFRDQAVRAESLYRSAEAALDTARWSGPGSIVAV